MREKLPAVRESVTHDFALGDMAFVITVGCYPDGRPGELFISAEKTGSTIAGLLDSLAIAVSVALQYGAPVEDLVRKFAHVRFEPDGFTGNPEIRHAHSVVDYVFRWMGLRFGLTGTEQAAAEEA